MPDDRTATRPQTEGQPSPGKGRPDQMPQGANQPKPPNSRQKLDKPGIEADMDERPRYMAPRYKGAGKLAGKVALITGGDSGIGRSVAVLYAREGADVAITYLPQEHEDAEETREAVEGELRQCLLLRGDLQSPEFCRGVIDQTVQRFGRLDILVHNAAHQNRKPAVDEITDEEWQKTFDVNITAYFRLVKAAMPHLQPGASIIATGSVVGTEGTKQLLDYGATKGAIHAFTKSLAQMLADKHIRCNVVAPGPVWTPLNPADQGQSPEKLEKFGSDVPMGRPAQPEEIAPAYVFLASDADSSYITGIVLNQFGGETTAG